MKKFSPLAIFTFGFGLLFLSNFVNLTKAQTDISQDATFAKLDILSNYNVQYIDTKCALSSEVGFEHADCFIQTVENECLAIEAPRICTNIIYQTWDAKLNEYYGRIMDLLPSTGQEKLREAQREWLVFQEKDNSSLNAAWQLENAEVTGTLALLIAENYRVGVLRDRTRQLHSILNFIQDNPLLQK